MLIMTCVGDEAKPCYVRELWRSVAKQQFFMQAKVEGCWGTTVCLCTGGI
jgi:hypothetical protein